MIVTMMIVMVMIVTTSMIIVITIVRMLLEALASTTECATVMNASPFEQPRTCTAALSRRTRQTINGATGDE